MTFRSRSTASLFPSIVLSAAYCSRDSLLPDVQAKGSQRAKYSDDHCNTTPQYTDLWPSRRKRPHFILLLDQSFLCSFKLRQWMWHPFISIVSLRSLRGNPLTAADRWWCIATTAGAALLLLFLYIRASVAKRLPCVQGTFNFILFRGL